MLAIFVIVMGFVTAAVIATASAIFQNSDGSLNLSLDTPLEAVKGFVLCMFAGPYILAKNSALMWVSNRIELGTFSFCVLISCLWSFCLGIVTIQLFTGLGIL